MLAIVIMTQTQYLQTLTPDILNVCANYLHTQLTLTKNPTHLTNPYWQWVVYHQLNPYQILDSIPTLDKKLGVHRNNENSLPPMWSFERMGQSETHLPDGRIILIGGEFDDYYDPNFCIFNDVVVKYPNGNIEIYGYPIDVFAPTDFHSATLIDDEIYIIGNIGYMNDRQYHTTPIYKLNINTLKINKVESRNQIGWIHHHTATMKNGQIIVKNGYICDDDNSPMRENIDEWTFNPKTLVWTNLTNHCWQGFLVERQDFDWLSLSEFRCLESDKRYRPEQFENTLECLRSKLGIEPNLDLYHQLFIPPITHHQDQNDENAIWIDGIKIRYVDDMDNIKVYIEGQLSDEVVQLLQDNLCYKLSKLENCPCQMKLLSFHTPLGVHRKVKKIKRV